MPNLGELTSLGDFSRIDPSINVTAFPGLPEDERRPNGSSVGTWSSTPSRQYGINSTGFFNVSAHVVKFWSNWFVQADGGVSDVQAKLRLVRSY